MNRRDILKSIGILPFMPLRRQVDAKEFKPDYILRPDDRLARYVNVFLNGAKVKYCFEAHVAWGSFERPTYGAVIVGATRPGCELVRSIYHEPREDECDLDGVLVKRVMGNVYLDLDPKGQECYQELRKALQYEARRQRILGS